MISAYVVAFGILCITLLELYALRKGVNGWLLRLVVVVIALAIGVVVPFEVVF